MSGFVIYSRSRPGAVFCSRRPHMIVVACQHLTPRLACLRFEVIDNLAHSDDGILRCSWHPAALLLPKSVVGFCGAAHLKERKREREREEEKEKERNRKGRLGRYVNCLLQCSILALCRRKHNARGKRWPDLSLVYNRQRHNIFNLINGIKSQPPSSLRSPFQWL